MKLALLFILLVLSPVFSMAAPAPFKIVKIVNFELGQPKVHSWEKERQKFKTGSIVLVKVNEKNFFSLGQSHNRLLMVDDRVLEMLNNGINGDYRVFISPVTVKNTSRVVAVESNVLAESLSKNKRIAMSRAPSMKSLRTSPISPVELRKINASSQRLSGERKLYNATAIALLTVAPEALDFVSHYLN